MYGSINYDNEYELPIIETRCLLCNFRIEIRKGLPSYCSACLIVKPTLASFSSMLFSLKINNGNFEFFVYEDIELINFEGENINPNIIKTIENNTFLITINSEVFQLVDK